MSERDPYLSVIIPAYNEGKRLPATLDALYQYLWKQLYKFEVIVVDNGSTDETGQVCKHFMRKHNFMIYLRTEQRGKGLAVRTGMLAAKGRWRMMYDADMSMPPSGIKWLLPRPSDPGVDVYIGSRALPGAQVRTSLKRRLIGRVFNFIVQQELGLPWEDTQCGYKCFSSSATRTIFSQAKLDGWAFDVELLYLAALFEARVMEYPITWVNDSDSRVRLLSDSLGMLRDVLRIKKMHAELVVPET